MSTKLLSVIPGAVLVNGQKLSAEEACTLIKRYGAKQAMSAIGNLPVGQDLCGLISPGADWEQIQKRPRDMEAFEVRIFMGRVGLVTRGDGTQIELNLVGEFNLDCDCKEACVWYARAPRKSFLARLVA